MKKQYRGQISGNSVVYRATNTINGSFYIGITSGYFSRRKAKHKSLALQKSSPTYFHRAIRKYGWDNFSFEILSEWADFDDAKKEEVRLISDIRPQYNMTAGGDGTRGHKHTPEFVAGMKRRATGRPGYWKGKKVPTHVVENLARIRNARTDKAEVLSLGPKSIQRRVVCLDDGLEFESIKSAALHYNVNAGTISSCCALGRHKTVGGRVFRFYGEHHGGGAEADEVRRIKAHTLRTGAPSYRKPIKCAADGLVFETVKDAAKHYGIATDTVIRSAKGRYKYISCNKLKFSYVDGCGA